MSPFFSLANCLQWVINSTKEVYGTSKIKLEKTISKFILENSLESHFPALNTGRPKKSRNSDRTPSLSVPTLNSFDHSLMRSPENPIRHKNTMNIITERKLKPSLLSPNAIPPKVTIKVKRYISWRT